MANHTGYVVITGASTGIGAATALQLDALGFEVFAGVRKEADGEALKARASDRLRPLMIDVAKPESIAAAAEEVTGIVGDAGIVGLVNNAGIAVAGPLEFVPMDELRRQLDINVIGLAETTQAFMPLIRAGKGRIVHMGSIAGLNATAFMGPYCASKHAVEALTDAMRQELRPWGIHVCVVEPGAIDTPIWSKSGEMNRATLSALPEPAHDLYADAFAAMFKAAGDVARRAIPAERVGDAVIHALTAKRPKTRYLVGTDAKIQAFMRRWLPDLRRDNMIARFMKIP